MKLINLDKIKLNARQKLHLASLSKKDQLKYLMTFLGVPSRLCVSRFEAVSQENLGVKMPKIYTQKGELLNFWARKNRELYNVTSEKKPDSSGEWYGVEIECMLNKNDFDGNGSGECDGSCRESCECSLCSHCGSVAEEYDCNCECDDDCGGNGSDYISGVQDALRKLMIKNIQVVSDGSLNDSRTQFGVEIKVLFKLDNTRNLEQVCEFLRKHDASVDTSCGLHVHVDSRNLKTDAEKQQAASKYAYAMELLEKMLPESRLENRYCLKGASFSNRYHQVNATALEKYGSIEIRAHSGTVNFTKILNWVKILDAVKKVTSVDPRSTYKFCNSIKLNDELRSYMVERISKFSPDFQGDVSESKDFEESEAA